MNRLPPPPPPGPVPARSRRGAAGFTLVEVLVALVIMLSVMGSTVMFFRSQDQSFLNASRRLDALQNARFAMSQIEREVRTLGAGVPGQQPMLVYGANNIIAFNSDYVENDSTDFRWAVYYNPNVTNAAAQAWLQSDQAGLPTTAFSYPPVTYRQANGAVSPAETRMFWLEADPSTPRADDFLLWERVNDQQRELVSRNILQYPGRPFLEFLLARRLVSGADTMLITPSALLPLIRVPLTSGMSSTDSANAVRPDSIQAVRMNFRFTNGMTGTDERFRDVSTMVAIPNNGLPRGSICGRSPFAVNWIMLTPDAVAGSGRVTIGWPASPDQESGEVDVWQYVLYRRLAGATIWEDPVLNIGKTPGAATYSVTLGGNTPGVIYEFGVSAEDCTPALSPIVSATTTAP